MLNPTALLASCGTGWCNLLREADHAAVEAPGLDELVRDLPAVLRVAAADKAACRSDPETFTGNRYLAAGWSERFRRIVAFTFDAAEYFAPRTVTTFASPAVPGLPAMDAGSFDDLGGVFVEQIASLSRGLGFAVPGRIIGAEVTISGVTARCVHRMEA